MLANLERTAEILDARYGSLPASAILRLTIESLFPGRLAALSSFGTESAVLLALIARIEPNLPIVFLDTGKHFPETLAYRDHLVTHLGLTGLRILSPERESIERADGDGNLWSRSPDRCCHLRKVKPLEIFLKGFDAWVSGQKRYHGDERSSLRAFSVASGRLQINPLAKWSAADLRSAFDDLRLPRHPLEAEGYNRLRLLQRRRQLHHRTTVRQMGACGKDRMWHTLVGVFRKGTAARSTETCA